MAYTTSGDYTIFTYSAEKLLARVRNRTAERVKMLRDERTGKPIYDDMALTTIEEADFDVMLPDAASAIFNIIQTLSQGVEDGFAWDSSGITYTTELPTYWDPNKTPILDLQIFTALMYWICKEWFQSVGMPSLWQEFDNLYRNHESEIRFTVIQRTQRATRPYRGL